MNATPYRLVACPACGAGSGYSCLFIHTVEPGTKAMVGPHDARMKALVQHLLDVIEDLEAGGDEPCPARTMSPKKFGVHPGEDHTCEFELGHEGQHQCEHAKCTAASPDGAGRSWS